MQLLSEEIDTQVSVLAGGGRGRDADNLTRTTLKDQEIAEADVVSWDRNGVWNTIRFRGGGAAWGWACAASYLNVNLFLAMC